MRSHGMGSGGRSRGFWIATAVAPSAANEEAVAIAVQSSRVTSEEWVKAGPGFMMPPFVISLSSSSCVVRNRLRPGADPVDRDRPEAQRKGGRFRTQPVVAILDIHELWVNDQRVPVKAEL